MECIRVRLEQYPRPSRVHQPASILEYTVQAKPRPLDNLLASAKANHVEPPAYARDLIDRFAKETEPDLERLLPTTWLADHPHARRNWSR